MHRSSESIGAIAAALAKAQTELSNPEKSLAGIIGPSWPRDPGRAFRYAPLSSGLDIARKSLGRHAIAIVQSTAIDKDAGLVRLNTVLAHSSGEWVSSEWPVCPIGDTASPQRMGAALTYARRYALFTLVGIAGEDDLDAPDICAPRATTGSSLGGVQAPGNGRMRGAAKATSTMVLSFDESAGLRDRLLSEIAGLQSQDRATSWARQSLPAKNRLATSDAKLVEDAFEHKLSEFSPSESDGSLERSSSESSIPGSDAASHSIGASNSADRHRSNAIDKSVLAVSAPRRYRNKEHLRFVARQPCLLCARIPSDAHHLRFVQPRALGRKASDEFAVPLCRIHHRAVHRAGDERAWWKSAGVDPVKVARKLWKDTRANKGHDRHNVSLQGTPTDLPPTSDGVDSKAP